MTLVVHVGAERVGVPLARERVADAVRYVLRAERVREALVSIAFVSERTIAALNAAHLGHRGPTDVIAFGFAPSRPRFPVIGDVYIAPAVARENARRHRVPVREELLRLAIHGTLHVLGYDHPAGAGREESPMWRRQEVLVARILGQTEGAEPKRGTRRAGRGRPARRARSDGGPSRWTAAARA